MKKIIFLFMALVGFSQLAQGQMRLGLEPLLGDGFGHEGVFIQVYSGGCTDNDSFEVVSRVHKNVKQIYFLRVKPDYCRAYYRYGAKILFSYEQLQINEGERFQIMNPRTAGIKQ